MWKRSEVDPNKKYQVALCAPPRGNRLHALHLLGHGVFPEHTVFLTGVVSRLAVATRFRWHLEIGSLCWRQGLLGGRSRREVHHGRSECVGARG